MPGSVTPCTSEEALWLAFRQGCEASFAQLYERYADVLFQYAIRFTPNRDLVKDCIHDLFVELWRRRSSLSATTSVRFYLLACVKRKVVKQLERQQLDVPGQDVALENHPSNGTLSPEISLIQAQDRLQLNEGLNYALEQLTKRQREAVFLKFYQDMPYDEIADLMGVNAQSVYNLVFGALRTLKKHLRVENLVFMILFLWQFVTASNPSL